MVAVESFRMQLIFGTVGAVVFGLCAWLTAALIVGLAIEFLHTAARR